MPIGRGPSGSAAVPRCAHRVETPAGKWAARTFPHTTRTHTHTHTHRRDAYRPHVEDPRSHTLHMHTGRRPDRLSQPPPCPRARVTLLPRLRDSRGTVSAWGGAGLHEEAIVESILPCPAPAPRADRHTLQRACAVSSASTPPPPPRPALPLPPSSRPTSTYRRLCSRWERKDAGHKSKINYKTGKKKTNRNLDWGAPGLPRVRRPPPDTHPPTHLPTTCAPSRRPRFPA